ncbi:tetratricopeptide repeat protein [Pleurocapsa sp. FMAR1]|uniref:tetratricopeptide repeat protein n=1 Tax=Pleurocapsa sp. FMAR1 TaxID=3040204 RepID=UPI0029C60704|nr:tetratricopeptide repeat protein [Pleurocapsa sp. FMAR1]
MSHTIGQLQQNNQQPNSKASETSQDSPKPEDKTPISSLADADYEFLFNQLLEGIAHGWHDHRIVKFFNQLGDRGNQEDWVVWLERLRTKVLALPIESKRQLGTMMIRLGELTQSAPEVKQIGAISNHIGRELLFGNIEDLIWEYVGSDITDDDSEVETEQDLSNRLPTDFTALGLSIPNDAETNLAFNPTVKDEQAVSTAEDFFAKTASLVSETLPVSQALETFTDERKLNLSPEAKSNTSENKPLDLSLTADSNLSAADLSSIVEPQKEDEAEAIDIQQLISLIQKDKELAQQISQKLNISLVKLDNSTQEQSQTIQTNNLDSASIELIESWFDLGLKQVSAGEFTKAIASWEKALQINPNLSEAWHNRGSALGRLGDYESAIASFQNALTIDPNNYQAWNDRAHALYQLEYWSEAIISWNNALKLMPANHLFWYNRGCGLEQLEYWSEAIVSYEKSLEIKPDFQPARSRYINLVADNSRSN